jgi:hypothetical protein
MWEPFGAHAGPLVHEALPKATAGTGPADGSARLPILLDSMHTNTNGGRPGRGGEQNYAALVGRNMATCASTR